MTPETIRGWMDSFAPFWMILAGVIVKYVPQFRGVSNALIGWINVVAYVLVNLLTGLAGAAMSPTGFTQASFASAIPNAGAVLLGGATNAGWALVLYETLGRTLLEKWLKLKKPA